MKYPTLRHPSRYVWDFWYWYDQAAHRFHLFYLNAPAAAAGGAHHDLATVGYGVTADFTTIEWGPPDVLAASPDSWDNRAIWSGDVVRVREGFLLFYTSCDRSLDDGYTQAIGIAAAPQIDARHWQRTPVLPLGVTGAAYEPRSLKGDASIHAWRDPFLFRREDSSYMLLAAKAVGLPLGRNGAVALLQAPGQQLSQWQPQLPLVSPGDYSEMEVPQLYQRRDGRLELLFSSTAALDFNPDQPHRGGLYGIGGQRLEDLAWQPPRNYLPAASGLYACRAIPELEGELVGFDLATGGIRRSGVKTYLDSLDRNFSNCTLGERA